MGESIGPGQAQAGDTAHARDLALITSQDQEEKLAREQSMLTRLLGWVLIAGVVFEVLGAMNGSKQAMGGFLFLIAGFKVLNGSQAWLRFAVFFCVPAAILGMVSLVWDLAHQRPIVIDNEWYDFSDLKFWTLGVSPSVYIVAEGILGVLALRTRRVCFWTKTVRICAMIFGAVIILKWGFAARDWMRSRDLQHVFASEIGTACAQVGSSRGTFYFDHDRYAVFPQIERIECYRSGNSVSLIYNRQHDPGNQLPQKEGDKRVYTEWCRDGSGKVGKLKIEFIVPKSP